MFEKSLSDIVKGIRASKRDTALYISQCIAEIKTEINSSDMIVKANALEKLTFLQMMGYGMSWASFATIEVMSSPRFAHKQIGYLSASQGFTQDTDVILLTTNLLKKELRGAVGGSMTGVYEAGLAINCISNIITEELAQDLLPELTNLTSHPQPYLRKKAILCLFKLFVKYPQGLRLTFAQLQQCLSDSNHAVVSCAVNVITELSDKNPRNYLHLAPAFFDLLTTSNNNWMLIKVVKLLGSLVPEEPRLARKLLDPLADIVKNTPAKSLNYEAVHAITLCLPYCRKSDGSMPANVPDIVALCAQTLRDFVEENDQNLKYLGLVGFGSLMQSHPKVLSAPNYRPLILACLSDEDVTIRTRALGLLPSMASRKNLMELVSQLLQHVELASGDYKLELVRIIVVMCSGDKYAMIQSFSWYLDTLFQLGHMRGLDTHAELLRSQVTDVALRVLPVRAYAVKKSIEILLEGEQINAVPDLDGDNGRGKHIMPEIVPALAWIVGEYADLIPEVLAMDENAVYIYNTDSEGPYHSVIQRLFAPANTVKLPASTQKVCVHAGMKVFAAAASNQQVSEVELEACSRTVTSSLPVFIQSTDAEVQERAFAAHWLLQSLNLSSDVFADTLPGLAKIEDEDDDEDEAVTEATEGNLLEMSGAAAISTVKKKSNITLSSGSTLLTRCRDAAPTLSYLLKPSPMKPTGAKAQRKKHQAPVGVDVDIQAPVDLSVFSALIEEENNQRATARLSLEAVSFTQQRPHHVKDARSSVDAISSEDLPPVATNFSADGMASTTQSFQSSGQQTPTLPRSNMGSSRPQTASDPFYLNSGPAALDADGTKLPNTFGMIQLVDGEGDSEDEPEVERRHRKKKKKKDKKKVPLPASFNADAELAQGVANVTVYDSDDDGVQEPSHSRGKRGSHGKEFDSLSKVDLTMPLREDEVMPERKHRVVPDRPAETPVDISSAPMPTKSKKKKKKESKKSKKASRKAHDPMQTHDDVGDLLDLGFGAAEETAPAPGISPLATTAPTPQQSSMAMQNQGNAVNNAFDDLLGLTSSTPVPPLSSAFPALPSASAAPVAGMPSNPTPSSTKSGKRPWLRATVKASHATGSPVVDWSKVHLSFKTFHSSSDGAITASIMVRVYNHMEMSTLNGLTLRLREFGDISVGDVGPGSRADSAKVGPFTYPGADMNMEMKGTLTTADCSVPVKLILPVSMHVSPVEGLTLEQVAQELASPQWSSHSGRIAITTGMEPERTKPIVRSFLRMAEVEPQIGELTNGTFAGQSTGRAQLRVLLKVKKDKVKIDLKSTNPQLGEALIADLKRLAL